MEKPNYISTILAIGLVIIALVLALDIKQKSLEDKNRLSVSGSATSTVEPDKVEVYVKIVTLEKTAQEARDKNSGVTSKVIDALKNEGIKDSDIETSQFAIYPKYEYEDIIEVNIRKSKQVLIGYEVINVLKVTTKELDKAGKIIDLAVENGANDIERVSFGLTKEKEKEIKQQAMVLASKDAKEKADVLAGNAGVRLRKPISISESSFYYQPFEFPRTALLEKAVASETIISPEKLDVFASVNIVYEIT